MDCKIPNVLEKFKGARIIALDIEATGGKKQYNKIIQLGVVEFRSGVFIREYSKTFGGGKSIPICIKIHGIKDEQRIGLPEFIDCGERISKYLSNAILVGHNIVACDMRMINSHLSSCGFSISNYSVIDTYRLATKSLRIKSYSLEECCREFSIPFGNHNALGDSWSSLLLLEEIMKKKKEMKHSWFFENL